MARLLTTGGETRRFAAAEANHGEGQGLSMNSTATFDTSEPWSGSGWILFPKATAAFWHKSISSAAGRTHWAQVVVKWSDVETSNPIEGTLSFRAASTITELYVEKGELGYYIAATGTEAGTGFKPAANTVYILELQLQVPAAGNGTYGIRVRDKDGEILYELAPEERNVGTTQPTILRVGRSSAGETECDTRVAQIILNDSTGSAENSWVGPQKVALLKLISDVARAGFARGAGGTTDLYIPNSTFPPAGVANGSKTNASQIYSANNNSTDYYEGKTADYDASVSEGGAGIEAGDEVTVVFGIARGSNSTTTSRNLALLLGSNPGISEVTLGTGGTAGGTEPTGWRTLVTAPFYVTEPGDLDTTDGVWIKVRKGTASTNAMAYDLMGAYVSYLPGEEEEGEAYEVVAKETITISDAFSREVKFQRTFAETVTVNDALAKKLGLTLGETVTINDALSKKFGKVLGETVTINDALASELGLPGGMYVFLEGEWQLTALRIF